MSQTPHLIANNIPGFGPAESRSLPCSGVSARVSAFSPGSSLSDHWFPAQVKFISHKRVSKAASVACGASSGGPRRNSNFSRPNNQGFSRNRNWPNEDRDNDDSPDETDVLASKNGPLFSFTTSPKSQVVADPGPREKEIVELFRKVQAKLRERTAAKEEKIAEPEKGKGNQKTVESLLNLLRKHSTKQGNEKISASSNGSIASSQKATSGTQSEDRSRSPFSLNMKERKVAPESKASTVVRPPSSFRRRSPVPTVKFQPIYAGEDGVSYHREKRQQEVLIDTVQQSELDEQSGSDEELESEQEMEPETVSSLADEDVFSEVSEGETSDREDSHDDLDQHEDLNSLKLAELRALAKSRGLKGFSKLKKSDLLELLAGSST